MSMLQAVSFDELIQIKSFDFIECKNLKYFDAPKLVITKQLSLDFTKIFTSSLSNSLI